MYVQVYKLGTYRGKDENDCKRQRPQLVHVVFLVKGGRKLNEFLVKCPVL